MTQHSNGNSNSNRNANPNANSTSNRNGHVPTNSPLAAMALLALALALPAAACAPLSPAVPGARPTGLLASGPRPAEIVGGNRTSLPSVRGPGRAPEHILQDPGERMRFMERMRVQILHRTRRISPTDYHRTVRPSLTRQLQTTGLLPDEVDHILTDIDHSRRM